MFCVVGQQKFSIYLRLMDIRITNASICVGESDCINQKLCTSFVLIGVHTCEGVQNWHYAIFQHYMQAA